MHGVVRIERQCCFLSRPPLIRNKSSFTKFRLDKKFKTSLSVATSHDGYCRIENGALVEFEQISVNKNNFKRKKWLCIFILKITC